MDSLIALRYFVVKDQNLFQSGRVNPPSLSKDNVLINGMVNNEEFKFIRTDFAFRNSTTEKNGAFGSLCRKKKTKIGTLSHDGIDINKVDNWYELPFYIDYAQQIIVILNKKSVITIIQLCKLFEDYKLQIQKQSDYSIKVEPIIDPVRFWSILEDSTGIFEIGFSLNAPNLFGASKTATEFQKELKDVYNQDKFTFSLENKNAALKYDADTLESYRDYADDGGGSWSLTVLKSGRRRKHRSYENAKELKVENVDSIKDLMKMQLLITNFLKDLNKIIKK